MTDRFPYRYLRAHARYVGLDQNSLNALLFMAKRTAAPADVYAQSLDGKWLRLADLEASGRQGSLHCAHMARKVREYAGEGLPPEPDPASPALKSARSI